MELGGGRGEGEEGGGVALVLLETRVFDLFEAHWHVALITLQMY